MRSPSAAKSTMAASMTSRCFAAASSSPGSSPHRLIERPDLDAGERANERRVSRAVSSPRLPNDAPMRLGDIAREQCRRAEDPLSDSRPPCTVGLQYALVAL